MKLSRQLSIGNNLWGPFQDEQDGANKLKEKDPGVLTVVDVLHKCLAVDPSDARFTLWLENLTKSAEEVMRQLEQK